MILLSKDHSTFNASSGIHPRDGIGLEAAFNLDEVRASVGKGLKICVGKATEVEHGLSEF